MIWPMLELAFISLFVAAFYGAGLLTGRRYTARVLIYMTLGVLVAACLSLEVLIAAHPDVESFGASILFYFYILPSLLGFAGGASTGWRRTQGEVR